MSKTFPVRWWRDDADRYRSRPPYVAPPADALPEWLLELTCVSPERQAEFDAIHAEIDRLQREWLESMSLPIVGQ
jgi:hypothetical protein